MENALQSIISLKILTKLEKLDKPKPDNKKLLQDIAKTTEELNSVMQKYNYTDDDILIESIIYQEKALRARYSYLLKQARENHVQYEGIFIKEG